MGLIEILQKAFLNNPPTEILESIKGKGFKFKFLSSTQFYKEQYEEEFHRIFQLLHEPYMVINQGEGWTLYRSGNYLQLFKGGVIYLYQIINK